MIIPFTILNCNNEYKIDTKGNGDDLKKSFVSQADSAKEEYEVKIIFSDSIGYGYDIYQNHKMFIHQPTIPGINSNKGFHSSNDASLVAEFVKQKLLNNIFPPTVSNEELKKLSII